VAVSGSNGQHWQSAADKPRTGWPNAYPNQTYYYLVESARVDGKPRIVSQQ